MNARNQANENPTQEASVKVTPTASSGPDINDEIELRNTTVFNSIEELQWKKYCVLSGINVEFEVPAIMDVQNAWGRLDFYYHGINTCGNEGDCDYIWFTVRPVATTNFLDDSSGITGAKFTLGGRESIGYTKSDPGDNICPEGWEVAKNNQGSQIAFHFCSDRFVYTSQGIDTTDPQVAKENSIYAQVVKRIRDSVKFIDANQD